MPDTRGYLKLAHGFPEHPKVEAAGGDAGWLHICALAYCSRNTTDGFIPARTILRISDREDPYQLASKLVGVGLWHDSDHTCKRCPKVPADTYYIHDYLHHQNSAERIQEVSQKRAVAGQRGGKAKAASSNLLEPGYDDASSKSLAEEEEEVKEPDSLRSSGSARKRASPPRGSRLPEDFRVTPDMRAWFDQNIGDTVDGRRETEKFRNYWTAKTGQSATKLDWVATWRNWMLKALEDFR